MLAITLGGGAFYQSRMTAISKKPVDFAEACYQVYTQLFFEHASSLPKDTALRALFFIVPLIGALVLAVAGLFQFSTLKYRCLEQCRMPMSFVLRHWRGDNARRQALHLGMSHGAYCVGCCWALMLLMFVVGMGSVGWMLLLAAVMAIEKNLPFGRRLSTPLGVALVAGAAVLFFQNGGIPLS